MLFISGGASVGVSVGVGDGIEEILDNISAQVSQLQSAAGTDETKIAEATNYETSYASLSSEYSQMEASQSMLSGSLSGLANYNKASLGLS